MNALGTLEAQTGMNLYIKNVLSRIVVDEEQGQASQLEVE